jgi:outer membrane protein assembly factor BamD (BamD/ComL family)
MKKIFYVALMLMMVAMTACQQSKEDYIKEFKSFVNEVSEDCGEYTDADWADVAKEFEALVKQAEKYDDLTVEETMELAAIQTKYAGLQAKKGINKVIDGVKDLFGGKKDKK